MKLPILSTCQPTDEIRLTNPSHERSVLSKHIPFLTLTITTNSLEVRGIPSQGF
ncbi:MAG: hypothetical protein RLZ84_1544 [Actinomycetota bacterium]